MKYNRVTLIICAFILVASLLVFCFDLPNPLVANNDKKIDLIISDSGKKISENIDNIKELNRYLLGLAETKDKMVTVNDILEIDISEYYLREGLTAATKVEYDKNYIFNKLVEEKILLCEAVKRNLIPSEQEVQNYIDKEKENSNPEALAFINKMILAGNLTEDEYWNVYEKYNVIRILAFTNLYNQVIQEAIDKGELEEKEKISLNESGNKNEYYKAFIKELKTNAKVNIEKKYKDKGFKYENKIFTIK